MGRLCKTHVETREVQNSRELLHQQLLYLLSTHSYLCRKYVYIVSKNMKTKSIRLFESDKNRVSEMTSGSLHVCCGHYVAQSFEDKSVGSDT